MNISDIQGHCPAGLLTVTMTRSDERTVVLTVAGEIDMASVDLLRDPFVKALNRGSIVLIVDMSGVTFCGACGLTALLVWNNACTLNGGTMSIVASRRVRRVIEICGLESVLSMTGAADPGNARQSA